MARIGDTIDASLGRIDYSNLGHYLYQGQAATGAAIASAIDQIGGSIVQGRKDESKVKAQAKLIEEAVKYLPDQGNGYMSGILEAMTSKETPLRDKLALGDQIVPLIELGISRMDAGRDYDLRERSVRSDERRIDLEDKRIGLTEKNYEREITGAQATAAEANAKALSDAVSVLLPLDGMLTKAGAKDDSEARKRVDKLISEGRGDEALTAAKEWAEGARNEINKGVAGQGFKLSKIGTTTPDGLPAEMDVLVGPDGLILDLEGNVITPAPAPGPPSAMREPSGETIAAYAQANGQPPASRTAPSMVGGAQIAEALKHYETRPPAAAGAAGPPVVDAERISRFIQENPSSIPFGAKAPPNLGAYLPDQGSVLPPRPLQPGETPFSGTRTVQSPRVGVRPMVSPKETPQEALAKSRQAAGDARLSETLKESQALAGTLPNLQQTKALLEEVETGFGAETIMKAKRVLGQDVASAEQLQTLLGDQVMARVAQSKGSISNAEMELFKEYSANFSKSPDGNRKIVEFSIKAAERADKIREAVLKGFNEGKTPFQIESELDAIRKATPITDGLLPPAPAPGGVPVGEASENAKLRGWLDGKR